MCHARLGLIALCLALVPLTIGCATNRNRALWSSSYTPTVTNEFAPVDSVQVRETDRISSDSMPKINGYRVIGSAVFRSTKLPEDWTDPGGELVEQARRIGADLVLTREREIGTEIVARTEVGAPPPSAPQGGIGGQRTGVGTTYEPVTLYEYVAWFYRSEE